MSHKQVDAPCLVRDPAPQPSTTFVQPMTVAVGVACREASVLVHDSQEGAGLHMGARAADRPGPLEHFGSVPLRGTGCVVGLQLGQPTSGWRRPG